MTTTRTIAPASADQYIATQAIYRFSAKRSMSRTDIANLLVKRAGYTDNIAGLLAGHWVATDWYRNGWKFERRTA